MSTADNKRMARNTIFLYLRSFVSMVISLYTSRKILEILGVDDFGILNVVGGVIAMFTFLSGSMSVATQRFLTFELGRGEGGNYKHVFSMTCIIHGLLALIFVLLGETIGLWFVNTQLNIPVDRMVAANAIYQMSIASVAVGILQTPYNASIVSYERMHVYAYVGIGGGFCKAADCISVIDFPYRQADNVFASVFLCSVDGMCHISCVLYQEFPRLPYLIGMGSWVIQIHSRIYRLEYVRHGGMAV